MSYTISLPPKYDRYNELRETNRGYTGVQSPQAEGGRIHDIWDGAPCEWSRERGATHTLDCGIGLGKGTRPAKLLKTVIYVGTDEVDGDIVWEKWKIKTISRNERNSPDMNWSGFFNEYYK